MARSSFATFVVTLALAIVLTPSRHAAEIDPNDKGEPLFKPDHPNITYLTDDNWDETMTKFNDRPWLVDFYHPFCPHCKHFVPAFLEIAAYYKVDKSIYIGAISCMDHVKCRRVGIKGFPTLIALNFDKKHPGKEVKRVVGTHTVQEVKDYVNGIFREAAFNETGTYPPTGAPPGAATELPAAANAEIVKKEMEGEDEKPAEQAKPAEEKKEDVKPGEQTRKELWEESTKVMTATTRIQDAASAFIFGLKQGVFMGREVLEDVELDALKAWLHLVSQTFPGSINRKVITKLYEQLEPIALLDFDTWEKILKDWQDGSVAHFLAEESTLDFVGVDVPEWQRLNNLFLGHGVTYRTCALYTCGQWNMFHMLTMNPPDGTDHKRSDQLLVSVIATMRRFMKHFFGCVQCRDHFLEYNNLDMVKKIQAADNKSLALKRWLWEMHNAVNTRIRHPQWPKPDICPTCGSEGNWIEVEVDKWLGNTYAYREVHVPAFTKAPTEAPVLRKEPEAPLAVDPVDPVAPQIPQDADKNKNENNGVWRPKDAALGIDNPAHKNHQPAAGGQQAKVQGGAVEESLQGAHAPPVSLFAWYILPIAAVAAYLFFVRSRNKSRNSFRHHARE